MAGLGFQLKERAWYDEPEQIAAELGLSKRAGLRHRLGMDGRTSWSGYGPCGSR